MGGDREIRIAWFSELYLFIFQQIQLVMVLLGVGIVRQRKPGTEAGWGFVIGAFGRL